MHASPSTSAHIHSALAHSHLPHCLSAEESWRVEEFAVEGVSLVAEESGFDGPLVPNENLQALLQIVLAVDEWLLVLMQRYQLIVVRLEKILQADQIALELRLDMAGVCSELDCAKYHLENWRQEQPRSGWCAVETGLVHSVVRLTKTTEATYVIHSNCSIKSWF